MATAEQLITEHIDVWTSAVKRKSGIGRGSGKKVELYGVKKLRELILDLAVSGLLVPQDAEDEPASVLLERVAAEKAELVKTQKIKKQKALPEISEDEKLFELPEGWAISRIGSFATIVRGITFPGSAKNLSPADGLVACLRTANVQKHIDWNDLIFVDKTFIKRDDQVLEQGDIVMSMANSRELVGKVSFVESIPTAGSTFGGFLSVIRTHEVNQNFIMVVLRSSKTKNEIIGDASQTTNIANISLAKLNPMLVNIPPLAEQHRIVAKVDELMALCDQLEQQSEASMTAHQTLVQTLLDALTQSASTAPTSARQQTQPNQQTTAHNAFEQAWHRIAEHFDTLFTTEHSIELLKQSILQLAVMGKLVPQDPNDEPASELLKRIAAEKAELVAAKKIKKQKALPEITEDEKPFALPVGWAWSRIGDVMSLKHGYAFKSAHFVQHETNYVLTTPGHFYETGGFRDRGEKTKYYDGEVDPEFLLQPNDLIIPMTEQAPGLLGSAAFIPNDGKVYIHNQRLGKLTAHSNCTTSHFIFWLFNSQYLRKELASTCSGTTVRHTSPDKILRIPFPVFSAAEQNRIVAKVDELMALCDQLKARLADAQTTQLQLADAVTAQTIN